MYYKDEIYYELGRLNRELVNKHLYLNLTVVGGAALIFNNIDTIETSDIDTITRLEDEIKEICEDLSIDINDEAIDYIKNYDDCEFIHDECRTFSNIDINYLCLGDVIKTKLKNCQDMDKMHKLGELFDYLGVDLTVDDISKYLLTLDTQPDYQDIQFYLDEYLA